MSKVILKNASSLFPVMPTTLISTNGKASPIDIPDIVTISRISPMTTTPATIGFALKTVRHSYKQILQTGEFVVNIAGHSLLEDADWCGIYSGSEHDKFKERNLTPIRMEGLNYAPAIKEAQASIGCRVVHMIELNGYAIIIGEIVSGCVDEEIMTDNNIPDLDLISPIVFDGFLAYYRESGGKLAKYGFSIRQ